MDTSQLPSIFGQLRPLDLVDSPAASFSERYPLDYLRLVMQPQVGRYWCWAATAASVATFLRNNTWTPCKVASECLVMSCCTGYAPSPVCDRPYALDAALSKVGCLYGPPIGGPISFDSVASEIGQRKRPVCCHITWRSASHGAAGHFATLVGFNPGTLDVVVRDPLFTGDQIIPYSKFKSAYQGDGVWDYTYLTS
jgi:hypothetical protein